MSHEAPTSRRKAPPPMNVSLRILLLVLFAAALAVLAFAAASAVLV